MHLCWGLIYVRGKGANPLFQEAEGAVFSLKVLEVHNAGACMSSAQVPLIKILLEVLVLKGNNLNYEHNQ